MKEYKSVLIEFDWKNKLDDQLNELSIKGWYIKDILKKDFSVTDGIGKIFVLLQRDVIRWQVIISVKDCDDSYHYYSTATEKELIDTIEKELLKGDKNIYWTYMKDQ